MTTTDPGACTGAPPRGFEPDCGCGHPADYHGSADSRTKRRPCSVANPSKCPCSTYTPMEDR